MIDYSYLFISSLILFSTAAYLPSNDDQLLSIVVIYRHGDRTPRERPPPSDPYSDPSFWPVEFGELTDLGKRQLYELGRWLRKRYDGFLPTKYSPKDAYIWSSDADRCIMSALSCLAGLYLPPRGTLWNPDIHWSPIPIHTIPKEDDPYLYQGKKCAKLKKLLQDLAASEHFKEIDAKNSDMYALMTKKLGTNITDFLKAQKYYDTWRVEDLYNLTLPKWIHEVYPDRLLPLVQLSSDMYVYTPEISRLAAGPLMWKIFSHFDRVIRAGHQRQKLFMISAQESNVADVLNVLEVPRLAKHIPRYASTVVFELYRPQSNSNSHHMKILYKRSTETDEPEYFRMNDSSLNWDYDSLVKRLDPVTIDINKWNEECKLESSATALVASIKLCILSLITWYLTEL